jgi:hypothetical protein
MNLYNKGNIWTSIKIINEHDPLNLTSDFCDNLFNDMQLQPVLFSFFIVILNKT